MNLFNKCVEDEGECAHKEFVDGVYEGYGFVVCDNCEVVFFMEEYGDAKFPFAMYCILVVTL